MRVVAEKYLFLSITLGTLLWWVVSGFYISGFEDTYSTVLLDRNNNLLSARIAADEQWRFSAPDSLPEAYIEALLTFEDKRFYHHPGIDPLAIGRALWQNITTGNRVSGGSTITMQVIRLMRNKPRTIWEKHTEILIALQLELHHSKASILKMYAAHAPFGGNVVGIEAAAHKYFGRPLHHLSRAEYALLAVLPNTPSSLHPGKNRDLLKAKRNRLLRKQWKNGDIDSTTCHLACLEPLPLRPQSLPNLAPHFIHAFKGIKGKMYRSSLDRQLQQSVTQKVNRHISHLKGNMVMNGAALVIDVDTKEILAYVGNADCNVSSEGCRNNMINTPRSSGSTLKPILLGRCLHEGTLMPDMLIPDIPTYYGNYAPLNYDKDYRGMVSAKRAISQSLNIPSVRMLNTYGQQKFYDLLQKMGFSTLFRSSQEYGLSLIIGGAEITMHDIGSAFAGMAQDLKHFTRLQSRYYTDSYRPLRTQPAPPDFTERATRSTTLINAGAVWSTFHAMIDVSRPDTDEHWKKFSSSQKIAWKTGTSYGARDAWAIGVTPDYVVVTWVGNADGEGRAGLTGRSGAAPLLFDIFNGLPASQKWFDRPLDDMRNIQCCKKSGYPASQYCPAVSELCPAGQQQVRPCPFHVQKLVTTDEMWRVTPGCLPESGEKQKNYFVLPSKIAGYYKHKNPDYTAVPPLHPACNPSGNPLTSGQLSIEYPTKEARIYVPTDLDEEKNQAVFKAKHQQSDVTLYWHIDDQFIGTTANFHEMGINTTKGRHQLTVVDNHGNVKKRYFEIVSE